DLSTYLDQLMKDAVRKVRASYAPPGRRTRLPSREESQEHDERDGITGYSAAPREDPHREAEPHTDGLVGEHRADLELIQELIGPRRFKMFSDIEVFGASVAETAMQFDLSRFQLHREMIAVNKEMAAAI